MLTTVQYLQEYILMNKQDEKAIRSLQITATD